MTRTAEQWEILRRTDREAWALAVQADEVAASELRAEELRKQHLAGANPAPHPGQPPAGETYSRNEINALLESLTDAMKEGTAEIIDQVRDALAGKDTKVGQLGQALLGILRPLVERIQALEDYSESSLARADLHQEQLRSLDARITATAANSRRGIQ